MRELEIRELEMGTSCPALAEISARLDELNPKQKIDIINWASFPYKPEVRFIMAYGVNEIYLKFYVREKNTKAEKNENNQMVCEDSCVEFFVSPVDDGLYYNFEFNPIGTTLLGCGTGRHAIVWAPSIHIDRIRRLASMGNVTFPEIKGDNKWTLTVAIPFEVFFKHNIRSIKGKSFRANFYKCGDKLSAPHYVTWNPVKTEQPDYHRPEYFGLLKFI
ncbi:MAG: carbohydrate-binding family 9-like protein [Kiritimatiellae bacterium]|nr:carbohydrate-binding family 9-like protein [Kiritimatiellia bacterium]MDD5523108.1 carbohydrate-binding family 9-like protein [Kiritimatiellia bacterium]